MFAADLMGIQELLFIVSLTIIFEVSALSPTPLTQSMIDFINNIPENTWKVGFLFNSIISIYVNKRYFILINNSVLRNCHYLEGWGKLQGPHIRRCEASLWFLKKQG